MLIGALEINLKLQGCHSLKDKRQILRSLLDRARRQFQVSIAEVNDLDLWQDATIGVAVVSNNARQAESVLTKVSNFFDECPDVEVVAVTRNLSRD